VSDEVQVRVGDWVLFNRDRSYDQISVEMKQAEGVTPKLIKFAGGYPRQINRLSVVAAFADKDTADRVRNSIAGVAGEFARRRRLAEDERSARVTAALEAASKQVSRLVTEARHD
jgi:hypothetical protein